MEHAATEHAIHNTQCSNAMVYTGQQLHTAGFTTIVGANADPQKMLPFLLAIIRKRTTAFISKTISSIDSSGGKSDDECRFCAQSSLTVSDQPRRERSHSTKRTVSVFLDCIGSTDADVHQDSTAQTQSVAHHTEEKISATLYTQDHDIVQYTLTFHTGVRASPCNGK